MKTKLRCRFLLNSWELISRFCKTFTLNCLQKKTPGTGKEHSMFTWFKSGNHFTLVYTEFFRKLNKMTLKSFLVIHVVCSFTWFILVLAYRVLVLTVRQFNMRHKIALCVKPQFTRNRTFPPVPRVSDLEGFHCIIRYKENYCVKYSSNAHRLFMVFLSDSMEQTFWIIFKTD